MASADSLKGRRILVCVSGSIAAYKSAYIVRELVHRGAFVSVALTPSAQHFVGAATFSALASEPAYDDLWDNRGSIAHTSLPKNADLVLVVPATASTIAKMAAGTSDDIVSASLLCTPQDTPIVVAPAMHEEMFDHAATQSNIAQLIQRGVIMVGPAEGVLAGGDIGRGRLEDTDVILEAVEKALEDKPLRSLTGHSERSEETHRINVHDQKPVVVVTAGGTREPIDTVRVITNKSTGKMGHALAHAASASGYRVILITTSDLPTDPDIERIDVDTAAQMHEAVMKYLPETNISIMTAAVADVTPSQRSPRKLKRSEGIAAIEVEPTQDIILDIVKNKEPSTLTVCFAAESEDVLNNAAKKFEAKGVDMMVVNDVSREDSGFGSETNKVWIFSRDEEVHELPTLLKEELAYELMDRISLLHSK